MGGLTNLKREWLPICNHDPGGEMETGTELFIHDLRDIYDAENKLINALETMANKVPHPDLQQAFQQHRKVTEGHSQRLERVSSSWTVSQAGSRVMGSTV
jgi:ferritin-like metal-binding protein YciE